MTAYVDASVLLRLVFGQPDALAEWRQVRHGVSSALILTECLRTLDRLRLRVQLNDTELATNAASRPNAHAKRPPMAAPTASITPHVAPSSALAQVSL